MTYSTRDINYNPVHLSTRHKDHITSRDPTYLLGLLDALDSDDSDDDELDGYVDLQDYTHSSINVHIQDETADNQDISFKHSIHFILSRSRLWHSCEQLPPPTRHSKG